MRTIIGFALFVLGILTMLLGGIGLFIYYLYDLVMNFETLSRSEIFWHIVWLLFRDVLAVGVGFVMFAIGGIMIKD